MRPLTGSSCTSRAVTFDPIRAELVSTVAPVLSTTCTTVACEEISSAASRLPDLADAEFQRPLYLLESC